MKATVRDLLQETDDGSDYEEGACESPVACPKKDCEYRCHISDVCVGGPSSENNGGKFYNHCRECPGFGKCVGDYRTAHCLSCNKHYFAGALGLVALNLIRGRGAVVATTLEGRQSGRWRGRGSVLSE